MLQGMQPRPQATGASIACEVSDRSVLHYRIKLLLLPYLLLHRCYFGELLRVLHTVVHVHLQPWPASSAADLDNVP